jgi:peptidyl-prolyl cis-trans isomerase SurA
MIDEVLQMQEAKRLGLAVNAGEVEQAIANIERQNGMPKGGLDIFLAGHGLDKSALVGQVEPQVAWSKVIGRRVRPQIQVSPEEVSETLARIKAGVGKPEYLLAEIFLRVDEAEDEAQIRQVAQRVIQQLQQPGANFAAVARNFSQAASAADGGNLGWVRAEELGDDLAGPVLQMQPGQVMGPIRTLSGFQIIMLRDRRIAAGLPAGDAEVQLQQLFLPLAADAPEPQVREAVAKAQSMAARAGVAAIWRTWPRNWRRLRPGVSAN